MYYTNFARLLNGNEISLLVYDYQVETERNKREKLFFQRQKRLRFSNIILVQCPC